MLYIISFRQLLPQEECQMETQGWSTRSKRGVDLPFCQVPSARVTLLDSYATAPPRLRSWRGWTRAFGEGLGREKDAARPRPRAPVLLRRHWRPAKRCKKLNSDWKEPSLRSIRPSENSTMTPMGLKLGCSKSCSRPRWRTTRTPPTSSPSARSPSLWGWVGCKGKKGPKHHRPGLKPDWQEMLRQ